MRAKYKQLFSVQRLKDQKPAFLKKVGFWVDEKPAFWVVDEKVGFWVDDEKPAFWVDEKPAFWLILSFRGFTGVKL